VTNSRTGWAEHVVRRGKNSNAYKILVGNLNRRGHLEVGVKGMIILKWILNK